MGVWGPSQNFGRSAVIICWILSTDCINKLLKSVSEWSICLPPLSRQSISFFALLFLRLIFPGTRFYFLLLLFCHTAVDRHTPHKLLKRSKELGKVHLVFKNRTSPALSDRTLTQDGYWVIGLVWCCVSHPTPWGKRIHQNSGEGDQQWLLKQLC